jgi:hypothetical protein
VLPLSFEANQGQVDAQVKYLARGQGYTLFLTPDAAVLGLRSEGAGKPTEWLRLALRGAAATSAIHGEGQLAGRSNYFIGNDPSQWRTNIPTFARVRYQQVYPGVDLTYYGRQGQLENDFEVAAGVNPKVISWQVEGAERIRVDSTGDLVLALDGSEVRLQQPRAYQWEGEQEREIPIHYRVHGQKVSFALGQYDRHQKLVIDPVLTYSTYLGGTGGDQAFGVAVDAVGDAYVTGVTASPNFPITTPVYQSTSAGDGDVFITEFNPTGDGIIFSTYLGGSGADIPAQILIATTPLYPTGALFLVGSTTSNNFPTTPAAFQTAYAGDQDAFLAEMSLDGSTLLLSTYIGGTAEDFGTALAVDSLGDVFVAGSTQSTDFPTMNPLQPANDGLYDVFVTEVSPTGGLLYSTYLGGTFADYGTGVAVDSTGNVYICGYTYSTNFPTQSALQNSLAGGADIFITKFTPGASGLLFSTYLGGTSNDEALAMVVDTTGNIYLTGSTQSPNFPVTTNAYQSTLLGTTNAFVTKMAPGGSTLVFSTLFGGDQTDQANAMTLDTAGNIYITGFTQSDDFPRLDSFQNILGIAGAGNCGSTNLLNVAINTVCADAFAAKFGPNGIPIYSSFLGGNSTDSGQSIAVDTSGAAYVVGETFSSNFPATAGAFQWQFQGSTINSNAFLTKISPQDAPSVELSPQQINFGNQPLQSVSTAVIATLVNEGSAELNIAGITSGGDFHQTNTCGTFVSGGGGTCSIQVTFTPTSVGLQTNQITITDNAGGTQNITVTGNGVLTGGSLLLSPTKMTFPAQTVNTTSPPQTALVINNGNQPVTITNISTTVNFGVTTTCGTNFPTVPASLNVGQSCTIAVSFTPTNSGNITGSVGIASNASNSSSIISLSGTGNPVFTLSSNQRASVVLIGTASATFSLSVSGPSTYLGTVGLSCSSTVTCSFSPSSVPVGGSSTLKVTGLTANSANPLNFTVTGTGGLQSSSVALAIFFADFSLAASPSGTTVTAGNNATYTITASPTNGFSQPVLLSCGSIPVGTTCIWNPPAVLLSGVTGSSASSTLTIETDSESRLYHPPWPPNLPPGLTRWILLLALLTFLGAIGRSLSRSKPRLGPGFRLALLLVAIVLVALGAGCENYVNPININPQVNGTPAGTYGIVLSGTLGNGSSVTRTTTVGLSVLP